jgi:hypothetical protein
MAALLRAELIAAKQMPETGPLFTLKQFLFRLPDSNAQSSLLTL